MEILWRNFHRSKLFSSTEKAKWERVQKDCIHFLQRYGFVDLVQASNLGPTNLSCWDHFTPPANRSCENSTRECCCHYCCLCCSLLCTLGGCDFSNPDSCGGPEETPTLGRRFNFVNLLAHTPPPHYFLLRKIRNKFPPPCKKSKEKKKTFHACWMRV